MHAWRGRVDAVVTGIGTVLADDPRLTARSVRPRRQAARVVLDPGLALPEHAALYNDQETAPLIVVTDDAAQTKIDRATALGARVLQHKGYWSRPEDLRALWTELHQRHGINSALVEAGGGVAGRLLDAGLVDELMIFITPKLLGDARGIAPVRSGEPRTLTDASGWRLVLQKRIGDDVACLYRRPR